MLNVVHLHTLQMVIKAGSLSAAAKELGYTTSAVSQQIASLEKSVGVALFERGPRSLWPTPAGVALVNHADAIVARSDEAEDEMRTYALGTRGRLRVGASGTVGAQLVPKALARLVATHPGADITVEDDGLLQNGMTSAITEGKVDLGLVFEYGLVPRTWPEDVTMRPILDEELVVIEGGQGTRSSEDRLELTEVAEQPWVTNRVGSDGSENFYRICAASGFAPQVLFTSNDFDVIRGLVKERLGLAIVPALALGIDRSIQLRRIGPTAPRRRVYAAYRKSDTNPLIGAAIQALDEASDDFLAWTSRAFSSRLDSPIALTFGDRSS
ncbi:LysR family transcriptional regulator [Rhodococcus sp. NPDC127530]|uniref:LysR family transcriptional regulator n=1 Tax=unclassified Rhodococcus (in: high G+C Gram-positive bacteria) TaxID=192944 RepID=UPI0036306594